MKSSSFLRTATIVSFMACSYEIQAQSVPFSAMFGGAGTRRFDPKSNNFAWAEVDLALRLRLAGEPFAFGVGFSGLTDNPFSDLVSSPANIPKIILESDKAATFFFVSEYDVRIADLPKPFEVSSGGSFIIPSFQGIALFARLETHFTYINVDDTSSVITNSDKAPFVDVHLLAGIAFSDGLHSFRIRLGLGTNALLDRAFLTETGLRGFSSGFQDLRFLYSVNYTSLEIASLKSRVFVLIGGSSPIEPKRQLRNYPDATAERFREMYFAIGLGWNLIDVFSKDK